MKYFLLLLFFVLFFTFAASAQTNQTSACPKISVAGSGVVWAGEPLTFTANIRTNDLKAISYQWTISNGTIMSGQGTPVIEVDSTGLSGENITATVEIKGLPEGCENKQSEIGAVIYGCKLPITLDEYGRIPFREEKPRLANVVLNLKKESEFTALFIIYFTKKESSGSIKKRVANIAKYLMETHKISKDKFKFVYSESDFQSTRIYLLPPDVINNFPDVEENLEKLRPPQK